VTVTRSHAGAQLAAAGRHPRRSLGQNFVVDPNTVARIARLAGIGPGDRVVEIGAGLGSLTVALAATGASVTAIEIDEHLVGLLRDNIAAMCPDPDAVRVVCADARTADWDGLLEGSDRWILVANLPYNIATPLVADLLDTRSDIARMLVMVQREAGERLVAGPGSKTCGAVSVKVAWWAHARIVGRVPADVFLPRPRVESVLVEIIRRPEPPVPDVDPATLFSVVRTGFAKRRKMLRGALTDLYGDDTEAVIGRSGVSPLARAEDLDVHQWAALALAGGPGRS
jgi:16S rRNA (adenine1518-N6/adenine1519-N6)-dimethyltransferase